MATPFPKSDQDVRRRRSASGGSPSATHIVEGWLQSRGLRETVESVVIAVVLAFLFRTFVAEPFVIPTGSMAPTLQGRHQKVTCPICGFPYRAGSSREIDGGYRKGNNYLGVCPQCGFSACTNPDVGKVAAGSLPNPPFSQLALKYGKKVSSSGGDRILVSKSAYEFDNPQRWDVFVFHFPGDAAKNYIKRLVGLPGESLRITHGDVFRSPDVDANDETPQADFPILHKPAHAIMNMRQLVYDNDYAAAPRVVEYMTNRNWPTRWSSKQGGWQSQDNTKSFQIDAADKPQWLRYSHYLASLDDWNRLLEQSEEELPGPGAGVAAADAQPQLITDGYAYNMGMYAGGPTNRPQFEPPKPDTRGMNWVGDLVVECQLESLSGKGKAVLELVEGGIRFQCELDLAAGTATLKIVDSRGDLLPFDEKGSIQQPTASIPMQGIGSHQVTFANVDDQLHLWIDGDVVTFDTPTHYEGLKTTAPTRADLSPVGIAAIGAKLNVDQLRLYRDVYYVASHGHGQTYCDLKEDTRLHKYLLKAGARRGFGSAAQLARDRAKFFSDPSEWGNAYDDTHQLTFSLRKFDDDPFEDQFFAMGDNSPHSQDSRLWWLGRFDIRHYVERKLIIGRAMLIYWPLGNVKFIQ